MDSFDVLVDDNGVGVALRRLAGEIGEHPEAYEAIGQIMLAAAIPFTPVLSGALVGDLLIVSTLVGAELIAGSGAAREYAGVQNYGSPSRNIAASLFMEAAADAAEDTAETEVDSAIDTLTGRLGLT